MRRYLICLVVLGIQSHCGRAQTGSPPFASFSKEQFDAVNKRKFECNFRHSGRFKSWPRVKPGLQRCLQLPGVFSAAQRSWCLGLDSTRRLVAHVANGTGLVSIDYYVRPVRSPG